MQITSRYGVRDRVLGSLPLSIAKSSLLDLVYGVNLRSLSDLELRQEAIRGFRETALHATLMAMKQAYKSRVSLKKIEYEEVQGREAVFYKDVVKRIVSAPKFGIYVDYIRSRK